MRRRPVLGTLCGATLLFVGFHGTVHAQSAETQTTAVPTSVPPLTDDDRRAAFPDVGSHSLQDRAIHSYVLLDQFEWQSTGDGTGVRWDSQAWIGGDLNRFWFRTEGERERRHLSQGDLHALYGRAIARWWDVVAGVRQDLRPGPAQTWAALGIQGLAPYWFEVQATAYVGSGGRTRARLEAEYELRLTNRLILQPRAEMEILGKADPEHRAGIGLSSVDAGLRVRYEFRREFASYVGMIWTRKYFGTGDLVRAAGSDVRDTRVVAGARVWF